MYEDETPTARGGSNLFGRLIASQPRRERKSAAAATLREGSIIENPNGSISFTPIRCETDLRLLQAGVSIALGLLGEL